MMIFELARWPAKMAAIPMVISEVLCYINNKYGKFDNKRLTSVIYDFYNADKISEAKDVLLNAGRTAEFE